MKLLAAGKQQNRRHGHRHRDPWRQRQGDGAEQISQHIEQRHDEPDIGLSLEVSLLLVLLGVGAVVHDEPRAQHHEAAGERDEAHGVEQIKRPACQREQRKSPDAAGPPLVGMREEFFKRQPEKETQAKKQRNARR